MLDTGGFNLKKVEHWLHSILMTRSEVLHVERELLQWMIVCAVENSTVVPVTCVPSQVGHEVVTWSLTGGCSLSKFNFICLLGEGCTEECTLVSREWLCGNFMTNILILGKGFTGKSEMIGMHKIRNIIWLWCSRCVSVCTYYVSTTCICVGMYVCMHECMQPAKCNIELFSKTKRKPRVNYFNKEGKFLHTRKKVSINIITYEQITIHGIIF